MQRIRKKLILIRRFLARGGHFFNFLRKMPPPAMGREYLSTERGGTRFPVSLGVVVMPKRFDWARAALLLAFGLAWLPAMAAGAADGQAGITLSRGRAAALLTALFYHDSPYARDSAAAQAARLGEGAGLGSATPRQAMRSAERGKVVAFSRSLVYEGGYYPREIYQILGIENASTARVARITRQLDKATGGKPSPWEVAGRVGRSGLSGSSDNWAMAPGADGEAGVSSPGTLAYLPALAIVYAAYPADGREAAAQLAILKDDDLRAASAARAAFSLLARVLVAERHDKDEWLRSASADSRDSDTEQDLRAVRVKDWRYLRGEECAMGRLERPVYIWYKGEGYEEIMEEGRKSLRSSESLAYLAALAAATYGMESLPRRVIASGASDRQLLELINDLHDLAVSEAVLKVGEEE